MVYFDNVLVIGTSFVEHLTNLKKVFDRFCYANFKNAHLLVGSYSYIWVIQLKN